MCQSVGGAKMGEPREKPPGTPASRTWLVSHVARAGLEPTPDTAVHMMCKSLLKLLCISYTEYFITHILHVMIFYSPAYTTVNNNYFSVITKDHQKKMIIWLKFIYDNDCYYHF